MKQLEPDLIRVSESIVGRRHYSIDPSTGSHEELPPGSRASLELPWSGFASFVKVGLLRRDSLFVALYVRDGALWLLVGELRFRLSDSDLRVQQDIPAPFVRRFRVLGRGRVASSVLYWFCSEGDEWAGTNFFKLVKDATSGQEAIARTIYCWEEAGKGRALSTEAFQQDIDRHIDTGIRYPPAPET